MFNIFIIFFLKYSYFFKKEKFLTISLKNIFTFEIMIIFLRNMLYITQYITFLLISFL